MNKSTVDLLNIARRAYGKAERMLMPNKQYRLSIDLVGQAASDAIERKLLADRPCMISRFGSNELDAVSRYLGITRKSQFPLEKHVNYILKNTGMFWWDEIIKTDMRYSAGFFPITDRSLASFGSRMIKDIVNIDVLGSWLEQESEFAELLKGAAIVNLIDLEPYFHPNPWSQALAGKTVLVIHPFAHSIQQQYQQRRLLFDDDRVLPEFELKTLKSVQSIAGNDPGFSTWFDALDWMCEQISSIDFDIAIIGAGAYGLPIASYVKNIGKKSVHLGGATQLLFGIKGQRWDDRPLYKDLYNQHWIKPSALETPRNHQLVEGGCYW
jgi:hypothetical protein